MQPHSDPHHSNLSPQTGLLCQWDWASESQSSSVLSKLLKLVLVFPNRIQLENIKPLGCSSTGNKEYTETGSLGEALLIQI